jgi:hypothetical protein
MDPFDSCFDGSDPFFKVSGNIDDLTSILNSPFIVDSQTLEQTKFTLPGLTITMPIAMQVCYKSNKGDEVCTKEFTLCSDIFFQSTFDSS